MTPSSSCDAPEKKLLLFPLSSHHFPPLPWNSAGRDKDTSGSKDETYVLWVSVSGVPSVLNGPFKKNSAAHWRNFLGPARCSFLQNKQEPRPRGGKCLQPANWRRWGKLSDRKRDLFSLTFDLYMFIRLSHTSRRHFGWCKDASEYRWDEWSIFTVFQAGQTILWAPEAAGALTVKGDWRQSQCSWNFAMFYVPGRWTCPVRHYLTLL